MAKRPTSLLADVAPSTAAKWMLVGIALCLLQVQGGRAQSRRLYGRIDRTNGDNTDIGSTFYVLQGSQIVFNCFCSGYESVEILHQNVPLQPPVPCHRLLYSINASTAADEGSYACQARLANDSTVQEPLGTMMTIDSSVVQAEPKQYGFLNAPSMLNCTTTLDEFRFLVDIRWFSGEGDSKMLLGERLQFDNTAISNEGVYTCQVDITEMGIVINRKIDFQVIVPPRIFGEEEQLEFHGNNRQEIHVPFQSRFMDNTTVTWWKDGTPLKISDEHNIQQTETTPPNSTTTLILNPTRRNDSGEYKVSVENQFDVIPRALQYTELCLRVRIVVPPAKPVISVLEPFNTVSWSLPQGINEDERAEYFTVSLNFTNGTIAQELALVGDADSAELSVVPGMGYIVAVTAHSQDGSTVSDVQEFTTLPGAPSIPFLRVTRLSNTSIELIVNLAYTGGGDITVLDVSFREIGTTEWIVIGSHDALSMSEMTWKAQISDERFIGIGVEFQVAVINTHGHSSQTVELIEPLDLPGVPTLQGISMSYNSLMIQLTLSNEGTPPILTLVVEFIAPEPFTRNFSGPFLPGEIYNLEVTGLRDSTQYSFTLSAVNYQGRGRASQMYNSTTAKRPPLPLYGIILIAIAAAALIVIVVVILAVVFMVMSRRHRQKKTYFFNNQGNMDMTSEEKQLDSTHEMVRRGSNSYTQHPPPTLPSSRSILSTSTANSSYLPTSPPFSPPGAPSILRISDPSSVERYRYETCSSTTSNSGQSDESDAGIRYTYNISPSPPAVEVDTPELRAQSTYSVMTTTTRMTSSSNSTRESLAYTHESNATVV